MKVLKNRLMKKLIRIRTPNCLELNQKNYTAIFAVII